LQHARHEHPRRRCERRRSFLPSTAQLPAVYCSAAQTRTFRLRLRAGPRTASMVAWVNDEQQPKPGSMMHHFILPAAAAPPMPTHGRQPAAPPTSTNERQSAVLAMAPARGHARGATISERGRGGAEEAQRKSSSMSEAEYCSKIAEQYRSRAAHGERYNSV